MTSKKPSSKAKNSVDTTLIAVTWVLLVSYILAFGASFWWVFDLFSNFNMQYMVGGLLLTPPLIAIKRHKHATLSLTITILCLVESRLALDNPFQFFSPLQTESLIEESLVKIVQYNHNIGQTDLNDTKKWLTQHKSSFDVIILQEASNQTVDLSKKLQDSYPYMASAPRSHPFGMVILSKYKILNYKEIELTKSPFNNIVMRLSIDIPNSSEPLTLYTVHAAPPASQFYAQQRNNELSIIANYILNEPGKYTVFVGDWNLTPYSPYFKKLKNDSGLNYQAYGLFLNPTWLSFAHFNMFKIPIDHLLHSDGIKLLDKEVGPAFISDHHSLITTLGIPKN